MVFGLLVVAPDFPNHFEIQFNSTQHDIRPDIPSR